MSKLLQIEDALRMIDAAGFQRLGEAYLYHRGYRHPHQIGLVVGGSKTRVGTPDTLLPETDGRYVFAEYTTQTSQLEAKLGEDLGKCLDEGKTGIPVARIREIVLCYTGPLPPDAVHRLSERCRAHGIAPHLISSGELAHALHAEFPALALEFLGVQTGLVETYGRERVRAKLEAERLWLDLQFNPVAVWRYMQEHVLQRQEDDPVKQDWDETLRLAHEISPRLPIQAPSLAAD